LILKKDITMTKNIIRTTTAILSIVAVFAVSQANARPDRPIAASGVISTPSPEINRTQFTLLETPITIGAVTIVEKAVASEVEKKKDAEQ
jgi:hypothetical protein